jgi:hypothetical protein
MRATNAIDFWRGFALANIFVNHMPGNLYSGWTLRNFAISDAAELFVFLAGWSLSYATGGKRLETAGQVTYRVVNRAFVLYQAQQAMTLIALAMLSMAALALASPLYLEWLNAGPVFYDTPRAVVGLALLTYQLGYFNILPLYVALLLMSPVFILLARWRKSAALALSLALYAVSISTGLMPPSWPSEDGWYFNPLTWQVLLVGGFLAAEVSREGEKLRRLARRFMLPAIAVAMVGAALALAHYHPDPMQVPKPRLVFLFDKNFLSPARLISLAALAISFHTAFGLLDRNIGPVVRFLCKLGRNSLPVFCIGSLLSLLGQIVRFVSGGGLVVDTATVACGMVLLGFTAWFVENGVRKPAPSPPPS